MKHKKTRRLNIGDIVLINRKRFQVLAFDTDGRCISKYYDGSPYYFGDAEGEIIERKQKVLFN